LRETTLATVAFAIALGWSLYQVASGMASLIVLALQDSGGADFEIQRPGIGWTWGGHIFNFQGLLQGLIELVVVLAVALLIRRRFRPR